MPRTTMNRAVVKPRLDVTLLAFALIGAALATLLPQRPHLEGRYALAIAHGEDLRLASGTTVSGTPPEAGARVLSCKRVVSVGSVGVGARCQPGEAKPAPLGLATAAAD